MHVGRKAAGPRNLKESRNEARRHLIARAETVPSNFQFNVAMMNQTQQLHKHACEPSPNP